MSAGENYCRCMELVALTKTDHEDELLVLNTPTTLTHRCLLCGRLHTVEHYPGDWVIGDVEFSTGTEPKINEGYRGTPLLSKNPLPPPTRVVEKFGREPDKT